MIYLLLISVVLIAIISYIINRGDIMAPSILLCLGYIISVLSAIYNIDNWNIKLHLNTYCVIILGILAFAFTEWIVKLADMKNKNITKLSLTKNKEIQIKTYKIILVIIFDIVILLLYFKEVYRISLLGGNTGGIANMMTAYRNITSYSTTLIEGQGLNGIVSFLTKGVYVSAYVFLFVFINNVIYAKQKISKNIKYLIPIILYIIQTFLSGARIYFMYIATAIIILSYILNKRRDGWNSNVNFKYIKIGVIGLLSVLVIFFFSRGLVGRTAKTDIMEYITNYAGGSIQLFNEYMQNKPIGDGHFGSETFIGIQKILYKFGVSDYVRIPHLEFRTLGNSSSGNVYTGFRRNYQDFGLGGMIVCQVILSFIFNLFYIKIRNQKKYNSSQNYYVIVYSIIISAVLFHSIADIFYMEILSMGYLIQFILLRIAYYFFVQLRLEK